MLDTGGGYPAATNAALLGIDLSRDVNQIVLSHGHYDHTGGLRSVLQHIGREMEIYCHPDVFSAKYSKRGQGAVESGQGIRYVGVPFNRRELESLGAKFIFSREPVSLGAGMLTTGEIPQLTGYEQIDNTLLIKENYTLKPDPLNDDLALVVEADFGLVVILGCAHRGLINTLHHACTITGRQDIFAVIGGTHLLNSSIDQLDQTITELKRLGVKKLGVSHCTGFHSAARLAAAFGESFFLNNAGTSFCLP